MDCKLVRTDAGSDVVIVRRDPPPEPVSEGLQKAVEDGLQDLIRRGIYAPKDHPLHPSEDSE